MSDNRRGIFRDSPPLTWSPDLGGFDTDIINLRLVSRRLAANPYTDTQRGTHPTSVRAASITLGNIPNNYPFDKNPLSDDTKFNHRKKRAFPSLTLGTTLGTVEYDNLVQVNIGKKPAGFRFNIAKDFKISLDNKINKLIFNLYSRIKGRTIYIPVSFTLTYQSQETEDMYGVIAITVKAAQTQQGLSFLSPNSYKKSILPSLVTPTSPLTDVVHTALDADRYTSLIFNSSSQIKPLTSNHTLYAKYLALTKYNTSLNTTQTIPIHYVDIEYGKNLEGMYTTTINSAKTIGITFNKGITSIPYRSTFSLKGFSQTLTTNVFKLNANNIDNITNHELIVYKYTGTGDASGILDKVITTGAVPSENHSDTQKILRFTSTQEFLSFVSTFTGRGYFNIGYRGVDFKTGEYIYYADENMAFSTKLPNKLPVFNRITALSIFDEITVDGLNLNSLTTVRVDVLNIRKSGESLADSFEVTPQIESNRISFNLELSPHITALAKSGKTLGIRVSLPNTPSTDIYTSVVERGLSKNLLANVHAESSIVVDGGRFSLSMPRPVVENRDGKLSVLLFAKGNIPSNPLGIPIQGDTTFNLPNIIGYLTPVKERYRKGKAVVDFIATITNGLGVTDVEALVLLNTSPGEDYKGEYSQYTIIPGLNLNIATVLTPVSRSSGSQWNASKRADFTFNTNYSKGGYTANPSKVYIPDEYYYTTVSSTPLIGEAFPDSNLQDTTRNRQEWRLVDSKYIIDNGRRWHGLADVVVETPYPITEDYTTQSVMIGREPCITSMVGDRYLTISGYGFTGGTVTHTQSGNVSRWESCVNGVSFYNKSTKALIAHVPYTDEVLRRLNGHEEFAVDCLGVYTSSIQDTYVVVSTDYGCDWFNHRFTSASYTAAAITTMSSSHVGTINRGDVLTIDFDGSIWDTDMMTSVSVQQTGSSTIYIDDNSKAYLRYPDGDWYSTGSFTQRAYCLLKNPVGFGSGDVTVSFDTFSTSLTYSYNAAIPTPPAVQGMLAVHPGTGLTTVDGWFTGIGLVDTLLNAELSSYSGVAFTFANAIGTHRLDIFDSKGSIAYTADGYDDIADAFDTVSTYTHTSSVKGGIAKIQAYKSTTSSFSYYYAVDPAYATIAQEVYGTEFEPIGSYGTTQWGLNGSATEDIDRGYAIPGVSNVPWGLFSQDYIGGAHALTKTNLLGKPKVSIIPSAVTGQLPKYSRIDAPVDMAIRGPVGAIRDVIDGNEVNSSFDQTVNITTLNNGLETFMPLVFNANHSGSPTHLIPGQAPVGNGLQAKIEYLDTTLFSKSDVNLPLRNKHSNQNVPQISGLSFGDRGAKALLQGIYQKSVYASNPISTDDAYWSTVIDSSYLYKGWMYTQSSTTYSSWEIVAEFSNDPAVDNINLFNRADSKRYPLNVTLYRSIKAGDKYLIQAGNTLRSNIITASIPEGLRKGDYKFGDEFIGGLKGIRTNQKDKSIIKFGAVGKLSKGAVTIQNSFGDDYILNTDGAIEVPLNLAAGDASVKVKDVVLNEYGYRDRMFIYDEETMENIASNMDNYHFTRIGPKPRIRIVSSLHVPTAVIHEGQENTIRGIPVPNTSINLVWLFEPRTGTTALVPNYTLSKNIITFIPTALRTAGFVPGDYVRVGVQDVDQNVYITPERYGLYGLAAGAVPTTVKINKIVDIDVVNPVFSFGSALNITNVTKAALLIPYKIKSAFDEEISLNIPIAPQIKNRDGEWTLNLSLRKHIKELMWGDSSFKTIYVKANGSHGSTNKGIHIKNTKNPPSTKLVNSTGLVLPPPKLAPSYKHTVAAGQELNPRTINDEKIYWSKQMTFDTFYSGEASLVADLFVNKAQHYLGRRFAGKHFLLHPDTIQNSPSLGVFDNAYYGARFSVYGNMYVDTSSGTVLSTMSSVPPISGNQLFSCTDDRYVRYLKAQSETPTAADTTEWQEAHIKFKSTCGFDIPDTVYCYAQVEQTGHTYPGLEGKDHISPDDLNTINLQLINLDTAAYTGSDAPTPVVDILHEHDYTDDPTIINYDVQPKQINAVSDHLVRITGKCLLGNVNRKTPDIVPTGYAEPIIRLYDSSSSSYVTGSFYKSLGNDVAYLDASSDARLYVKFRMPSGGWPFTGWGNLYIETKWSIAGGYQTYSATFDEAFYVTATPSAEIFDERIPPVVSDSTTYSYKTFNYASLAHATTVPDALATDYTPLSNVSFKISKTGDSFSDSITANVYRMDREKIYEDKMFMDPIMHKDNFYGVWFSSVAPTGDPQINWWKYSMPTIAGTALDAGWNLTTHSDHTQYAQVIQGSRYDYGVEVSTTGSYAANVLSSTTASTRGYGAYRRSNMNYHHYDMPRIVSVIGTSKDNIINYVDGQLTGGGAPSIDILCEGNFNGTNTLGSIQGIRLDFGNLGGSSLHIGMGTSLYGKLVLLDSGSSKLVRYYPSKEFGKLLGTLRTGGWLDVSIYVGHPNKIAKITDTNYRAIRVGWTAWDTTGTTGATLNAVTASHDAVMYRLRMIEGDNGDLRVAWATNFDTDTYETSHQEAIHISGSQEEWWVFAATSEYGQENPLKGSMTLYGAREKDLIANLDNYDDIAGVGANPTITREATRGLQLLGTFDVGPQAGMAFIDQAQYNTAEHTATVSNFRFNVGRSPHLNNSLDLMAPEYSTTSGTLLDYEYIDADISDVVIMPRNYSSADDVANFSFTPKRREWVLKDAANLAGAFPNVIENPDFAFNGLTYMEPALESGQLFNNGSLDTYTTTAPNDPPTGWTAIPAGTSVVQINTTGGIGATPCVELQHDAIDSGVALAQAVDVNGDAFKEFTLYRVSCMAKTDIGTPTIGCRGATSYTNTVTTTYTLSTLDGATVLTTSYLRYSAYVWGRPAGIAFLRGAAATSATISIDDLSIVELGVSGWYTDFQETTIEHETASTNTQIALLSTTGLEGSSIKQDIVLSKNTPYTLSFDSRYLEPTTGSPEVYMYPEVTIVGHTYLDTGLNKVDASSIYYNFNTKEWDNVTSSATVYDGPVSQWWHPNNSLINNNINTDISATVEVKMASRTSDYTSTAQLGLRGVSCKAIDTDSTVIQNGSFTGYISSSNTTSWAWTLADATAEFISTTVSATVDRPMSGNAVLNCPATTGTVVPSATQTIEKYAIQPACDYMLKFKAYSSDSTATVSFSIFNSTQALYLQDNGTWAAGSNDVAIPIDKSATTTVSEAPLIISQIGNTYTYTFDTHNTELFPSDIYSFKIGSRLVAGAIDYPRVLIDDIHINRYNTAENTFEGSGLGDNVIVSGDGGLYLPHDASWDFKESYSAESIFRIKNTYRDDSIVGTKGDHTSAQVYRYSDLNDGFLRGDSEPYMELINIGHGESSKGAVVYLEGGKSGANYVNRVQSVIGDGYTQEAINLTTNLETDTWYWVGLSQDTAVTASLTLYQWDGRRDTQSWQFVETLYATTALTISDHAAQPISIGQHHKEFFHLDGFNTFLDPTTGKGADIMYRPNESAKFVYRFNDKTSLPHGMATIPNHVLGGSGTLYITASDVFKDDSIWGEYSIKIPLTSRQNNDVAIWMPGGTTVASALAWDNLSTIPMGSSMACLQGALHSDTSSNHRHRALTVACWTKIESVIDDSVDTEVENAIVSWGDPGSNGSGFLMTSAEESAYMFRTWSDILSLDTATYNNDWGSLLQFAIPKGDTTTQSEENQVGFTYYNNIYTSGSNTSFMPELCVSMWSPESLYTTAGDTRNSFYLRMRGLGSDGTHATQSVNEWWLNLNSFMIDDTGNINYYSLRIPEESVINMITNNDSTIFDLTAIDSTVSQSKYGVLINYAGGLQGAQVIGDDSWWDLVTNNRFMNETTYINGVRYDTGTTTYHSLTMSVGSELTGYRYYDGKISELAVLPDIFMDNVSVQDWLKQTGTPGLSTKRVNGSCYVTEIGATRVNGFPLKNAAGTMIEGMALEESQTNINFRFDQEGNTGTDDARRMGM